MAGVVLVTGAAGGVGRRLLPRLQADGWRVRCLVHRRPVAGADEALPGDLLDAESLQRATSGADAVLHLAARTHARRAGDYQRANVEGTRLLLDAAADAGVRRFVHVSTRAIDASGGAYSRSKREAERLVENADLPWSIVRLPEVYGAGGEGVDAIIDRARRGAPIPIVGEGADVVCPIHVDDAVGALAAALVAPGALGTVYTLAGECLTLRAFVQACAEGLGRGSSIRSVPVAAVRALALVGRVAPIPVYPDQLARLRAPKPPGSPEAASDLGFAPRGLRAGLASL